MDSKTYTIELIGGSHRNSKTGRVYLTARRSNAPTHRERLRRYELALSEAEQENIIDTISWWIATPGGELDGKRLRSNQIRYLRSLADAIEKEAGL